MDAGFILPLIYLFGRTSFLVFMRDAMLTPDSRIVNSAYKEALRGKGRGYNKDFFKATWWVYALLLVFYVGGVVTGYLLLKDNPNSIRTLSNSPLKGEDIYDLSGRKLSTLNFQLSTKKKAIYIQNNKKLVK